MNLRKLFFVLPLAFSTPASPAANIIDATYGVGAGSFEIPGYIGPLFLTLNNGSNYITGWTVNYSNIDLVPNTIWNPSLGANSIDMNGTPGGPGGIQTVIPTTVGTTYRVAFDIAAFTATDNMTNPKTMDVTADGVTSSFSLSTTTHYDVPLTLPLAVNWQSRTLEFIASTTSTTISFTSTTATDGSAMLLDNVVVQAVPEPAASLLMLGGGALLTLRRRRLR